MHKLFKIIKYSLLIGLPCVLLACMGLETVFPEKPLMDWLFAISLAGFVGISTNTIAIRMLFRPRQTTFFGRQGLIPRNKKKIARKIAVETEKKLLNVESIMAHIEQGRMIEESISLVIHAVEDHLAREDNRKRLAGLVLRLYNEYADKLFLWLSKAAETYLTEFVGRQVTVESVWLLVKPRLKAFFDSDDLKNKTATWIMNNLVKRTPELARIMSDVLEQYIEEQVWWKKTVLHFGKKVSGIDTEAIEKMVRDIIYSQKTYDQICGFIEDNLGSIESYLEQDDIRSKINDIHCWLKNTIVSTAREKALPALREQIDSFLNRDTSWHTIDRYLVTILQGIPPRLTAYLHQPATIGKIRSFIPDIIQRFNVREIVAVNIEKQDMAEFEGMIVKVAGENLAAIEVLGGFLGMFAGLALKEPIFLVLLPAGIAAFLVIEYVLMKIKRSFIG